MGVVSIELAVMVDFAFTAGQLPDQLAKAIKAEAAKHGNSPAPSVNLAEPDSQSKLRKLSKQYEDSEEWLWYRSGWSESSLGERLRVFLPEPMGCHPEVIGLQIMLLPKRGVGVATAWVTDKNWGSNPSLAKVSSWGKGSYWADLGQPGRLFSDIYSSSERNYAFLAVCVDATDLTSYCRTDAEAVASWFTGGSEQESHERQLQLVGARSNISVRRYERLFVRWTDALALYNLDPQNDDYLLARCRAAQLYEHCILARSIFRTDGQKLSKLSKTVGPFRSFPVASRSWWNTNKILSSFSQAEYEMMTAPPVRFGEAGELVRRATENCDLNTLVNDIRTNYELLQRRLQWLQGQWLAIFAVCAFLANALIALLKK